MNNKKKHFNPWNTKKNWSKVLKQGLQVLFHIVMAKFPIPENCSAYVPLILKEFCSSKINGLVMKNFFRGNSDIMIDSCTYIYTSFSKGYYIRVFANNSVHLKWVIPEYIYKIILLKLFISTEIYVISW
jgi:hypothetical protein